ncbi:MAG TPA: tetratricopeptide repeat protein [Tepidisphaeraceae bacterium]|nr:tetratricopeptide repeat protein [Tepidisphaeraceae bacterium]
MKQNHGIITLKSCLLGVVLLGLVSCASSKEATQKEEALKRWDDARSGVLVGLATDQYDHGNLDRSRATIDEAINLSPDSAVAHLLSAKLYIEAGQLEVAERELVLVHQDDPNDVQAYYLSGIIFQRWQQPERALECYQHACDEAPAELAYVLAKAEMLVAMDRRPEALALLQSKTAYFEHSGAIRDEVGLLFMQDGQSSQAVEMFRRASILAGDDLTIKEHLARALFDGQRYAESAGVLSDLVTNEKFNHRPDLLIMLGECQLQSGRPGDAVQNFQSASEMTADSVSVWLGLARANLQLNSTRRAELALRRCLSVDPNNSEAYLLLGYLQFRQSQFDQAEQAFARASQLDPSDAVALCMVGLTLDKLGRVPEAAVYYQQALKIRPHDALATRLMARLDVHQ